jgi:glycosyltransferase involved in cell wall biosynthesis
MQVTVFTPAYNRGYIIKNLYISLCAQKNKNFEWLIVDDGSTDNTGELIKEWQAQNNGFDIIYIKTENGGKHRAINTGVRLARGELFFIVDSDDYLTDDAINKLICWRNGLSGPHKFAGVAGARGYDKINYIGQAFTGSNYIDARNTEREHNNLNGDKAEAYFTEVLKKYPFPEFENENFVTEEAVWNAIAADGYYLRWHKDIIYICNYLDDGLTKSGNAKYINNPQGVLYWVKIQMRAFPKSTKKKLSAVNRYYEAVKHKKTIQQVAKDIEISVLYCRLAVLAAKLKRKFKL